MHLYLSLEQEEKIIFLFEKRRRRALKKDCSSLAWRRYVSVRIFGAETFFHLFCQSIATRYVNEYA